MQNIGIENKKDMGLWSNSEGSLKNNFTFYTPMHLLRLRCESSESAAADSCVFAPCRQSASTPKTVN
jgi:hypothetical protein